MCNFRVGQKVVVSRPYDELDHFAASLVGDKLPLPGIVYTVREIEEVTPEGFVFIRLAEVSNSVADGYEREAAFNAARFRPVVDRKTDISVFTALLNTSKSPVLA